MSCLALLNFYWLRESKAVVSNKKRYPPCYRWHLLKVTARLQAADCQLQTFPPAQGGPVSHMGVREGAHSPCSQVLWACAHLASQEGLFLQAFPGSVLGREGQDAPWQGKGPPHPLRRTHPDPRELPLSRKIPPHKQQQTRARELSRPAAKTAMVAQTWVGRVGNQASQGDLRVQPSSRSQRETLPRQAGLWWSRLEGGQF